MLGIFESFKWIFSGIGNFLFNNTNRNKGSNIICQQFKQVQITRKEIKKQTRNVCMMAFLSEKFLNDKNSIFFVDNDTALTINCNCKDKILPSLNCQDGICEKKKIVDCAIERAKLCDQFLNSDKRYFFLFFVQYNRIKKIYENAHPNEIDKTLKTVEPILKKMYEKYFN